MNDFARIVTPKKELANMQVVRLGNIMFCFSIVLLAFMVLAQISAAVVLCFYGFLLIMALLTLFLLFLVEGYVALLENTEAVLNFTQTIAKSWVVTLPALLVVGTVAIVCLCRDKSKRSLGKIVFCGVAMAVAVAICIYNLYFRSVAGQ